jgi:hypothetical protein
MYPPGRPNSNKIWDHGPQQSMATGNSPMEVVMKAKIYKKGIVHCHLWVPKGKLYPNSARFAHHLRCLHHSQCSRVNRPRIVAGACQQGIFDLMIGVCQVAQQETCPPRRNEERSYPSLIISFASCQIPWKIWRFCETSKKILGKHGNKIWEHPP